MKTHALKEFGLFRELDDSQLSKIAELCHVYPLAEGDQIFVEGTRATDIHFCSSGKVDIVIWIGEPWNKNVPVHRVGSGELLGWSTLVAPYTFTASAVCVEAGEEIRVSGHELLALLDEHPIVGYGIMTNLDAEISARLMQTRRKLSIEWLAVGSVTSFTAWGEPGKR